MAAGLGCDRGKRPHEGLGRAGLVDFYSGKVRGGVEGFCFLSTGPSAAPSAPFKIAEHAGTKHGHEQDANDADAEDEMIGGHGGEAKQRDDDAPNVNLNRCPGGALSAIDQSVVDVVPVGGEKGLTAHHPPANGEKGVEDRVSEREQRDQYQHDGVGLLGRLERRQREEHPEGERAGISQEDSRGVKIPAQEPEKRPSEKDHHDRHVVIAQPDGDHRVYRGGEEADSGGQTIQPVGEVDGIGDADDPKQGGQDAHDGGKANRFKAGKGKRDGFHVKAEEDGGDGHDALHKKFHLGPNAVTVVNDSQCYHAGRANEDSVDLRCLRAEHLADEVV